MVETSLTVILGIQWGDEAKGKLTDYLMNTDVSQSYDIIARSNGGPNAGHTVKVGDTIYKFHSLPSGCLNSSCQIIIGHGCVINLERLIHEIDSHPDPERLKKSLSISTGAHIILPIHILLDTQQERERGSGKIGTTGQGIGPVNKERVNRSGLRIGIWLSNPVETEMIVRRIYQAYSQLIDETYIQATLEMLNKCRKYFQDTAIFQDTIWLFQHSEYRYNRRILLEGAQSTLLDPDYGYYPFTTSGGCSLAAIFNGLGFIPSNYRVIGVMKIYATRVGSGPFPTEFDDLEICEKVREVGHEYGTTTGRPRRCGWLDLPSVKYSIIANRVSSIFISKLDVLDGLPYIKVGIGYEGYQGSPVPIDLSSLQNIRPVYKIFQGWKKKTSGIKNYADLPDEAKSLLKFIETELNTPIAYIGTGKERQDIIAL